MTDEADEAPHPAATQEGPASYANWRAQLAGAPSRGAYEVHLYSDAHFIGEVDALGPYRIFNAFSFDERVLASRLVLRSEEHIVGPLDAAEEPDPEHAYTGSLLEDELACLCSLAVGARVAAGAATHVYGRQWIRGEPRGRPSADRAPPALLVGAGPPRIPFCREQKQILPEPFSLLPSLTPANAAALVRAARSYRDALWLAESQPELAWVLLVSAVEAAAATRAEASVTPEARLADAMPGLVEDLREHGDGEVTAVAAKHLAHLVKSTAKFLDFLADFPPEVPAKRPTDSCRIDWSPDALRKMLRVVYGHRSKALHESRPFPAPMCGPAWRHPSWDAPAESAGPATGWWVKRGQWRAKEVPFTLHTFEYVVRSALLKWWRRCAESNATASPSTA